MQILTCLFLIGALFFTIANYEFKIEKSNQNTTYAMVLFPDFTNLAKMEGGWNGTCTVSSSNITSTLSTTSQVIWGGAAGAVSVIVITECVMGVILVYAFFDIVGTVDTEGLNCLQSSIMAMVLFLAMLLLLILLLVYTFGLEYYYGNVNCWDSFIKPLLLASNDLDSYVAGMANGFYLTLGASVTQLIVVALYASLFCSARSWSDRRRWDARYELAHMYD